MTQTITAVGDKTMSEVLLAQVLDRLGEVLETMGAMKTRLDHGQKQFEALHREHANLNKMIAPVAAKVTSWDVHIEAAKVTTNEFNAMKPEFRKMEVVTARFLAVALVQGTIVSAALWGIWMIAPVVWEYLKTHFSFNPGA